MTKIEKRADSVQSLCRVKAAGIPGSVRAL